MEVIAIKPGFHGKLRQVDDKFDVPKGSKATWFEPVTAEPVAAKSSKGKPGRDKSDDVPPTISPADDQPLV